VTTPAHLKLSLLEPGISIKNYIARKEAKEPYTHGAWAKENKALHHP